MPENKNIRLKPIPIPLRVRWTEFRRRIIPAFVFLGVVVAVAIQLRNFNAAGIPGVAEGVRSVVTSPQMALLQELNVRPYQWVEAGQPLLTLVPADPRAPLDLLQSELQLARLQLEPSLAEQNALDFERLRVEHLRLQQEMMAAQVNLARAETTLQRHSLLRKERLVSEDTYELTLRDRDLYRTEVQQKQEASDQVKERLEQLRGMGEPKPPGNQSGPGAALLANLELKTLHARTNWAPMTIRAPISGMVQLISRQPGEFVGESEPLLTVCSDRSDHVVGFLRQPYVVEPKLGMQVEVFTRTRHRKRFLAEVSQIGAQVETITNSLAFLRPGVLVDVGLPIIIAVPPHVNIRPGEAVDILFRPLGTRPRNETVETQPRFSRVD